MTKTKSKVPKILLSSEGNGAVSLTVKGAVVLIVTVLLSYFGIVADNGDVASLINNIVTAIGAIMTVYGLIRKYINANK